MPRRRGSSSRNTIRSPLLGDTTEMMAPPHYDNIRVELPPPFLGTGSRFLAGLDVALVQKCHEHGVTNLQEALRISMQAERAIEASRMHGSTPTMVIPPYPSTLPGAQPLVGTLNADVPDQTKILVQSVTSLTEQVSNLCLKVGEFISSSKDSRSEGAYDQNYRSPCGVAGYK